MKTSLFKHYKGGIYKFLCECSHTETGERMVAYLDLNGGYWVRPSKMFFGKVAVDGVEVDRFKYIGKFEK